jgi:arsenate reductase
VARRFERVSDQATNICEEALYFATGEYLRHRPSEGFRVLFVDETNGCLSRMAVAIGGALGAKRFTFSGAGLTAGDVDPQTVRFLAEKGMDISRETPKSTGDIPDLDQVQVIVALCRGAEQVIPRRPAKNVGLDWFIPDPSKVVGTPEEIRAAYQRAYDTLSANIRDLVQAILGNDEHSNDDQKHLPL